MTAATMSTIGRDVGHDRREQRGQDAGALLPRRRADAVAVDDAERAPRVVVRELHGHRAAHGVAEQHDRAGLDLVHDRHHLVGQVLHGDVLPLERVAAAEARAGSG